MADGPKKYLFKLPEAHAKKGEQIINHRYRFVDGSLEVDEVTGRLIEPILTGYYGATLTIKEAEVAKVEKADGSLATAATKAK